VQHVVLVLDGPLQLVPMDALPAADDGTQRLGDVLRIETRMTLGELLDAPLPLEGERVLVGLGGAEFDGEQESEEPAAEPQAQPPATIATVGPSSVATVPGILRDSAFGAGFGPLPGTLLELAGLEQDFVRALGAGATLSLLRGRDATRDALVAAAPRARWLHIATHGWFAPESIRSWEDRDPIEASSGLALRASGEETVKGMSPMMLCGLALAGANLPEDALGRAPGLLTADELSTLDLSNCELAVLSACDTARGEMRRAGQGVASLQKALQIAGARSVITSLWKVPDEATKELMLDFYRRVWAEKQPKWKALWEAKRALREAKDEAGNPKYTLRDWAAWVLTGEPE
jgi:CHAT domain-containing protein